MLVIATLLIPDEAGRDILLLDTSWIKFNKRIVKSPFSFLFLMLQF